MIPVWKNIPFLRLLIPLMSGTVAAWYFQIPLIVSICLIVVSLLLLVIYSTLGTQRKFSYNWLFGTSVSLFCMALAVVLVQLKQVSNQPVWFGHLYKLNDQVQIRLLEPLTEKEKSFKALAEFVSIGNGSRAKNVTGKLMLYFRKDSVPEALQYGSIIVVSKAIPEIKNADNPGGFDYKRYALFNGITHQLFLNKSEYVLLRQSKQNIFYKWLFRTRAYILSVLRKNIKGKEEVSVAEALLIGYRDDLDRDLVQAYSNTGVVHVIAISGLHLGLIYWLLLILLKPLDKFKKLLWLKPLIALLFLWIFSLLTGAGASVVRAAIMFTFIALGDVIGRKGNIYNSMAASAFVMLLWNPFLLWDVGFQLSYAAVLSIVLFMKPIYNILNVRNKILDKAWQLNAVTLSAQILTLPFCIYHFHQAPNLFLITNFVAVPLSSLILFGEILLIVLSFSTFLSNTVGFVMTYLLKWMNGFITWIDHFSFAVTDGIMHTPPQTIFLYLFIAACGVWLLRKNSRALKWSMGCVVLFFASEAYYTFQTNRQKKLVVYNLSQHAAIDVMIGNTYVFMGDSVLLEDGFLRNFHLKPARIYYRTYHHPMPHYLLTNQVFNINNKSVMLINSNYRFTPLQQKIKADVVVVSHNPKLYMKYFLQSVEPKLMVFDSSNPLWKIRLWQKDCEQFRIPFYITSEQGAFVMNL